MEKTQFAYPYLYPSRDAFGRVFSFTGARNSSLNGQTGGGRLQVNGKKRYMPIVALGALLISLFAILPATGAGEVSFIAPAI